MKKTVCIVAVLTTMLVTASALAGVVPRVAGVSYRETGAYWHYTSNLTFWSNGIYVNGLNRTGVHGVIAYLDCDNCEFEGQSDWFYWEPDSNTWHTDLEKSYDGMIYGTEFTWRLSSNGNYHGPELDDKDYSSGGEPMMYVWWKTVGDSQWHGWKFDFPPGPQ